MSWILHIIEIGLLITVIHNQTAIAKMVGDVIHKVSKINY